MSNIKINQVALYVAISSTLTSNYSASSIANAQAAVKDRTAWRGGSRGKGGKTKWPRR